MERFLPFLLVLFCGFLGLYAYGVYGIKQKLAGQQMPLSTPIPTPQQLALWERLQTGKRLFQENCENCHSFRTQSNSGVFNASQKYKGYETWLISYIIGAEALRNQGDPWALALYEENNRIGMPDIPHLSPQNVRDILTYLEYGDIDAHEL